MKRLISLILVLSFLFVAMPTQAYLSTDAKSTLSANEVVFNDQGSEVKLVYSEDQNGNSIIKQYVNGALVSEAKTIVSENKIISTSYRGNTALNGKSNQTTLTFTPITKGAIQPMAYTSVGRIRYNYANLGGSAGQVGVNISRETTVYSGSRYNVNGLYQDLAAFTSFIAGVLSLPFFVASAVARAILTALGIGLGATSIVIPNKYLRANEEINTWKLVDTSNSGHVNYMSGTKFTIVEESPQKTRTYYEGDYYPSTAFANHDLTFANTVFMYMFTYPSWDVYAWN